MRDIRADIGRSLSAGAGDLSHGDLSGASLGLVRQNLLDEVFGAA